MAVGASDHWEMERIKRRLGLVATLVGPARAVVLLGLPPASDIEGQMRVEGLESLLDAHGIASLPRGSGAEPGSTVIWLGDGPEELDALRRRVQPGRVLLWPRPEGAAEAHRLLAGWSGPPPVFCSPGGVGTAAGDAASDRIRVLPDPAHALWGLLDHHPRGEGLMRLPDEGWDGLLPPARLAMLRRCARQGRGLPLAGLRSRLCRVARRRVLEAARRAVAAHAEVSGTRVGGSILAALLGRPFHPAPAAGADGVDRIGSYWAAWRTKVDADRR